jgi:hypothetical protein
VYDPTTLGDLGQSSWLKLLETNVSVFLGYDWSSYANNYSEWMGIFRGDPLHCWTQKAQPRPNSKLTKKILKQNVGELYIDQRKSHWKTNENQKIPGSQSLYIHAEER